MEYEKIINLLDNTIFSHQNSEKEDWSELNDDARET